MCMDLCNGMSMDLARRSSGTGSLSLIVSCLYTCQTHVPRPAQARTNSRMSTHKFTHTSIHKFGRVSIQIYQCAFTKRLPGMSAHMAACNACLHTWLHACLYTPAANCCPAAPRSKSERETPCRLESAAGRSTTPAAGCSKSCTLPHNGRAVSHHSILVIIAY